MITFEMDIFYPKEYKQDHIDINEFKSIWYRISTNEQQSRWKIAVTIVNNGTVVQRNDLSKLFFGYSGILDYIKALPRLVETSDSSYQIGKDYLAVELDKVIGSFMITLGMLERFKEKYCAKEKDNQTKDSIPDKLYKSDISFGEIESETIKETR